MNKPVKTEGAVKKEDFDAALHKLTQSPRIKKKDIPKKKKPPKGK